MVEPGAGELIQKAKLEAAGRQPFSARERDFSTRRRRAENDARYHLLEVVHAAGEKFSPRARRALEQADIRDYKYPVNIRPNEFVDAKNRASNSSLNPALNPLFNPSLLSTMPPVLAFKLAEVADRRNSVTKFTDKSRQLFNEKKAQFKNYIKRRISSTRDRIKRAVDTFKQDPRAAIANKLPARLRPLAAYRVADLSNDIGRFGRFVESKFNTMFRRNANLPPPLPRVQRYNSMPSPRGNRIVEAIRHPRDAWRNGSKRVGTFLGKQRDDFLQMIQPFAHRVGIDNLGKLSLTELRSQGVKLREKAAARLAQSKNLRRVANLLRFRRKP